MSKIAVLGAGGFGTALAVMADKYGNEVLLWSAFETEIEAIRAHSENRKLLPGVAVQSSILLTSKIEELTNCELYILAVPSFAVREVARTLAGVVGKDAPVVNVAKGFEPNTLKRLSQVISEELPLNPVVILSGPSHAEEVARGIPTTVVASSTRFESALLVQDLLMNETLRIYANDDIIGAEIGGALKNIIALAAGICDGLELGDNTKAALMTRGLTEITRLGCAMGAKRETFAGLTGIGDLIVTCTSMHSRNRRAGILIGQGMPPEDAVKKIGTVEGYVAGRSAFLLAKQYGVEMPIVEQLCKVLFEGVSVGTALQALMERPKKHEVEKSFC